MTKMHILKMKCHIRNHIKSTTTESDNGLDETELRLLIRNKNKTLSVCTTSDVYCSSGSSMVHLLSFFKNAFKRLKIICLVQDRMSEKVAEPAGAGLAVDSLVCPSAHTDFDPGKRESLANIQR